jgi:hypothetical protein
MFLNYYLASILSLNKNKINLRKEIEKQGVLDEN